MNSCAAHPDREAVASCNRCGARICAECRVVIKTQQYCKQCTAEIAAGATPRQLPALAALLSFLLPGAGQVYNGQTGKGILFFLSAWLIVPWIISMVHAYKTAVRINAGELTAKKRVGCLIAFLSVGMIAFVLIPIIGLLAAIAIPNLLRARINANEAFARSSVRMAATAFQSYRAGHQRFPVDEKELTEAEPPYWSGPLLNTQQRGYQFDAKLSPEGYLLRATPVLCGNTGGTVFIAETDKPLQEEPCAGPTQSAD